jgi:hypothetical protein
MPPDIISIAVVTVLGVLGFFLRGTLERLQKSIERLYELFGSIDSKLNSHTERIIEIETRCSMEHGARRPR